ncbi:acyltransferase family protein [Paenibacillus graminis]|uniref:acyltransferase family protein n=1 Tax=Paenibacillus graminis TaxID=189425 RepID=UPI002DB7E0B0|nr:acyltransferase family protein [Paenibacillus graminis]MEC0167219.1 acyltransferase family protein [Paenibacillus graminis]
MNGKQNHLMKRYMPGIDGLRAISVLAVIAYHFNLKWAQGGLLGVGVFFVLSGYLITDQILLEWKRNSHSIWNFWIRRFRRLVPAMVFMLISVALWLIFTDPSRLRSLQGDMLSSIFYMNNWYLIFHEVSYFESFGPASPIGHLWSLSIEEQFYMVWPITLFIGLRFAPRRGKLMLYILVLIFLSAMAMAALYVPGTDPSRVYYGTDTRAFAILIGAALAVGWPSWKLDERISSTGRSLLDITGGLGLLVLLTLMYRTNKYDDFLYPLGFLYLSVVSAVIIAVLAHPASRLGGILGCRPLAWIGKRSYSLYIWHYPVIILMNTDAANKEPDFTRILLQITVILMLSVFSYKYIEEPVRRGKFRAQLHSIKHNYSFRPIIGLVLTVLIYFRFVSWITASAEVHPGLSNPVIAEKITPDDSQDSSSKDAGGEPPEQGEGVTAIGDSLILNVAPALEAMLPGIIIDGEVGRQMSRAQDVVNKLRANGKLGNRIILELGTNGSFNKTKLRLLLGSLKDAKQVYLVTTRVPENWQDSVNKDLKEVAGEFQHVNIIDWYSASANKNGLFAQDGVHLTPEGSQYYASLLAQHMKQDQS